MPAAEIAAAIDDDTAVVELSHVNYRTAEIQDMAAVTRPRTHKGALIVWDLAHSSGALSSSASMRTAPISRSAAATSSSTAGPARRRMSMSRSGISAALDQPLTGWFAHAAPFAFER